MLKRCWSPRRPLSLPMNHCLLVFIPLCGLLPESELVLWPRKYRESDTVWLPRPGHKKSCYLYLDLSIYSLLGKFCPEQLHAVKARHMEMPQVVNSQYQLPAMWMSQSGHPARPGLQVAPALAHTWLWQHERPQVRTAQLSPVNPLETRKIKCQFHLRMF